VYGNVSRKIPSLCHLRFDHHKTGQERKCTNKVSMIHVIFNNLFRTAKLITVHPDILQQMRSQKVKDEDVLSSHIFPSNPCDVA
jgi:hypothetical protein